jgi:squalene-hopene/tetraprenyl-beta-curcumene cyclase
LADIGLGREQAGRAAKWLAAATKPDGGWSGGMAPGPSSVEETALAVEALSATVESQPALRPKLEPAIRAGVEWLAHRIGDGSWTRPRPIGFYFAKLWYFERLYPIVFTVAALARAERALKSV